MTYFPSVPEWSDWVATALALAGAIWFTLWMLPRRAARQEACLRFRGRGFAAWDENGSILSSGARTVGGARCGCRERCTWESALGFYRAFRHPAEVKAIAYMEAIVQPRRWEDFPSGRDAMFRALRSPQGERMILSENFFVETVLPKSILRTLSDEEMEAYRAPYRDRDARLPTLVWPRELPIDGEPADVVAIIDQYGKWLSESRLPKLFVAASPGAIMAGRARDFCHTWPNQQEVEVKGIHFIQEDSPAEIGAALQRFIRR